LKVQNTKIIEVENMRKEVIGDAILYCGDCFEVIDEIESESVEAFITDPPYSSGGFTRGDRMAGTSAKYQQTGTDRRYAEFAGDNRDQRSWTLWCSLWLQASMRITKQGAMYCLFTDWRQLPSMTDALQTGGLVWRGLAVWDKINGRPMPNRFRQSTEFIVWGTNGAKGFDTDNAEYHDGVFRFTSPPTAEREHTTQKPVELMEQLVKVAKPGKTVFDPFMGSGTTGVACLNMGRKFIGVELTEHYFDVSCKRIEQAMKQPSLFDGLPEPEASTRDPELEQLTFEVGAQS
jgi:site-specific DNA-methyltransferase (adenine-specific)